MTLEDFKISILELMSKYPIDTERESISITTMYKRSVAQKEFVVNEKLEVDRLGALVIKDSSKTLEDVQQVFFKTLNEHFRVGTIV